ncbi:MAG: HD domain-containing protein [Peptococcaceae bacterium]|nr:HD domain-containing protein [Peptococcaceae bacterium]
MSMIRFGLNGFSSEQALFVIIIVLITVMLVLLIFVFILKRSTCYSKRTAAVTDILFKAAKNEGELDGQLNAVLEAIISAVQADGYYFYIFDSQSDNYRLRVSRHKHCSYQVTGADYSGLVPYDSRKYSPPLGIAGPKKNGSILFTKDQKETLLELCLEGGEGLIRIGPVRSLSVLGRKILEDVRMKLGPLLHLLLELEYVKNHVETIKNTNRVIHELNQSVYSVDQVTQNVLTVMSRTMETSGCCLGRKADEKWDIPVMTRLAEEVEFQFRHDQETLDILYQFLENKTVCQIKPDSKEFYGIPYYFLALGIQSLVIAKTNSKCQKGIIIFWYKRLPNISKMQEAFLEMMAKRLGEIWDQQEAYKALSFSYIKTWKTLIETLDNLEPHTVGHSELIVRYSVTLARQMNLSPEEIEDIKLAAYFHDIGMISLSGELANKQGRFNPLEYETIKFHPEAGATMIESTIVNQKVASYIRHHHERWDGLGYPGGLGGNQIPLGARVIAAADFFTAKIQGRKYREPLTFEQAITDMSAASGTQLDPEVVEVFLLWFKKKQLSSSRLAYSLGWCWEMRCCPSHIRENCPAYQKKNLHCWDIKGVCCEAHGNHCDTCIVYTEFIYRKTKVTTPLENSSA